MINWGNRDIEKLHFYEKNKQKMKLSVYNVVYIVVL